MTSTGTAKRFWNWTAERYSRQAIADEASYQQKLELTQKYLSPESRVVEFGCGTGSTAVVHAPKVADYLGIDVAENMVGIARAKASDAGLSNLRFQVGTLEDAGLTDESCDAVVALNILHLVPDLGRTLETVAQILKPQGWFVSSTICLEDVQGGLRWLGQATRALPFLPTVQSFSAEALDAKFLRAGFTIEERLDQRAGIVFRVARKS